jgi:hypothetical protein
MSEELKHGPIKGAHIRQSLILGKWRICTGEYVDKNGLLSARNNYPIPDDILERIALDWLVKSVDGCDRGYSNSLYGPIKDGNREKFKFCIERVGFVEKEAFEKMKENGDVKKHLEFNE